MSNVLVVCGHTDLSISVANKTILENLKKEFSNAKIDVLSKLYPDYKINVKEEQEKLKKADIIVLQFPFFWYSCPSIMRKWFEDVLLHGFAYGSTGKALDGKKILVSFTLGAPEEKYHHGEFQNFEIDEFMPQFHQLANLCSMEWCGYVCSGGYSFTEEQEKKIDLANQHSQELINKIHSLLK